MLDLDPDRVGRNEAAPVDAATLIVLRDATGGEGRKLEVFCVQRNARSRFMGGAIVFPGGKLDAADRDPGWGPLVTAPWAPRAPRARFADDEATLRALAVAACREALEDAALLPVTSKRFDAAALTDLRRRANAPDADFRALVAAEGARLDLAALRPFARWVTPAAESRRYDARFYVVALPPGQEGAHDENETTESFWAPPSEVLQRFEQGDVQLAPPQHRLLEMLSTVRSVSEALSLAERTSLDVVCPELTKHKDPAGETLALLLPGDRALRARGVVPGKSASSSATAASSPRIRRRDPDSAWVLDDENRR